MMRPLLYLVCLFALTGCASYEYNLTQPPDLARHIGKNSDQVVALEPLEYRFRTYEDHLVVRVWNQTDEPIELLGDKSFVVDPEGQSHPLRGQTIAPHAFVKLIFPPIQPRIYDPGPTFGVGVGVGVSRNYYNRYGSYPYGPYYPPYDQVYYRYYDEPRYLYVIDEGDQRYWNWEGNGTEIRLTLVFRQGDKTFQNAFSFKRVKM